MQYRLCRSAGGKALSQSEKLLSWPHRPTTPLSNAPNMGRQDVSGTGGTEPLASRAIGVGPEHQPATRDGPMIPRRDLHRPRQIGREVSFRRLREWRKRTGYEWPERHRIGNPIIRTSGAVVSKCSGNRRARLSRVTVSHLTPIKAVRR
jgi:hypothetical protein